MKGKFMQDNCGKKITQRAEKRNYVKQNINE